MGLYPRKTHNVFGAAGVGSAPSDFAQYGSETAGTPIKTTDIATIQELPAWGLGWQAAIWPANKAPLLEDWNSWCYEHSYQIGSIFEEGIPVWDVATVYDIGSWVQDNVVGGQVFQCLQAGTVGGTLPTSASTAAWRWANPPAAVISGSPATGALLKVTGAASVGAPGSYLLAASAIKDDGTNIILSEPLKFADGSIQTTAAVNNAVTAQGVVTGSRALNTVFQNTSTTKPMFVSVTIESTTASVFQAITDNAASPTTIVAQAGMASGPPSGVPVSARFPILFIVLPGNYYKVSGGGSLITWTEWQ